MVVFFSVSHIYLSGKYVMIPGRYEDTFREHSRWLYLQAIDWPILITDTCAKVNRLHDDETSYNSGETSERIFFKDMVRIYNSRFYKFYDTWHENLESLVKTKIVLWLTNRLRKSANSIPWRTEELFVLELLCALYCFFVILYSKFQ